MILFRSDDTLVLLSFASCFYRYISFPYRYESVCSFSFLNTSAVLIALCEGSSTKLDVGGFTSFFCGQHEGISPSNDVDLHFVLFYFFTFTDFSSCTLYWRYSNDGLCRRICRTQRCWCNTVCNCSNRSCFVQGKFRKVPVGF